MDRRFATIVVCIGLSSTAYAVEWSMNTTLREAVELSDNPFQQTLARWGIGSHSSLFGNITGQTKTSRFDLSADVNYRKYWGPAAETGSALSESNGNSVALHYETRGKVPGDRNYIDASWRRQSTATAIFEDLGVPTNVPGDTSTLNVIGGIARSLTPTDFWTWSSRATLTGFDAGSQFLDIATTNTFRHQSNRTSAITAMNEFEWLKYESNANILLIRYMAGLDLQPYRNMSFVFSAGATTAIAQAGDLLPQAATIAPSVPSSAVATGFVGSARLTYRFWPTTELGMSASRSISPSIVGVLTDRISVGASVRHTINNLSSLSASVDVSRLTIVNGQTDFFTGTATYSRSLARDWDFALTYRYILRGATTSTTNITLDPITGTPILLNGSSTSTAASNSIIMVLSKRFVLLPKRT